MRYIQILILCIGMSITLANKDRQHLNSPIYTNTIQRFQEVKAHNEDSIRPLKKVFLSNRSITCNDGSQSGFYLRKSHTSKKWIIFLEGGWYCYDHQSCRNRWLRQRHYMTSSNWPETRDLSGILSPNSEDNPYWYNSNHVFIPYCTSDSWSGTRTRATGHSFSFMGHSVLRQVVKDILPLGLENSTDLLLTGSSAGGTGVMVNLDWIKELLHDELALKNIDVRGVTDSGWFLDRTPYAPTFKPAVDAIRKGMELWKGQVPKKCKMMYPGESWRCYFGYRLYPTLKTDLFVFQWLFDEAQMDVDNVGAPVTKQQWDYIHQMGDALRQSFENVSSVFAPSCISHSVLTKRDWLNVKIDDISLAEALHCWEQKLNRKRRNNRKLKKSRHKMDALEGNEPIGEKRKKRRKKHGLSLNQSVSDLSMPAEKLPLQRSPKKKRKHCNHRRLERCSWPQCNHSCPRLHNPFTGEEMDFIEMLKSFGLNMESVAKALGIDMHTLNNMDHSELLNLLTQQSN